MNGRESWLPTFLANVILGAIAAMVGVLFAFTLNSALTLLYNVARSEASELHISEMTSYILGTWIVLRWLSRRGLLR